MMKGGEWESKGEKEERKCLLILWWLEMRRSRFWDRIVVLSELSIFLLLFLSCLDLGRLGGGVLMKGVFEKVYGRRIGILCWGSGDANI